MAGTCAASWRCSQTWASWCWQSEVVGQLILAQRIDLVGKVLANAPHAPRVRVDGLGLQTLELEVLEVGLVLSLEMLREVGHDGKSSMGGSDSRLRIECVNLHLTRRPSCVGLLRVAASSNPSFNPSFEPTRSGRPLQAIISFSALRALPPRAAQLKR